MRIGIDVRSLYRPTLKGIGIYLRNLLLAMGQQGDGNEYHLFYDSRQDLIKRKPEGKQFIDHGSSLKKGDSLFLWEQVRLPQEIKRFKIDLFHSSANTTFWRSSCPVVVTVHDTKLFETPRPSWIEEFYMKGIQPLLLRRATRIICPSAFTRQCVMERLRIPENKVTVVYLGLNQNFKVLNDKERAGKIRQQYGISDEFVFSYGGETPSKNISNLLRAFAYLKKKTEIPHQLVVTGIRSKEVLSMHLREARELGVETSVLILGYLPEDDLVALLNVASVFVYPSLFEGFGFPPIEAMACGVPVAASDATSIPEIVGDAALFFDGRNPQEMADQIYRIIREPRLAEILRQKGFERIRKFSWDETAKKTLRIYQEAVG